MCYDVFLICMLRYAFLSQYVKYIQSIIAYHNAANVESTLTVNEYNTTRKHIYNICKHLKMIIVWVDILTMITKK